MVFLRWLIGGLIGAAIGGAVWVAIGYSMEAEVGYVAWGIGFLCGLGVQMVGGEHDGYMPGFVAVLCAALSILISKYVVISMLVANAMGAETPDITIGPENIMASFAEEIIEEKNVTGKPVKLPPTYDDENVPLNQQYPKTIWREAKKKWDKLTPNEQTDLIEERKAFFGDAMHMLEGSIKQQAFMESFNFFDLLWFGLAAFTAFRVGSGLAGDDE